jgi:hypothetical protein
MATATTASVFTTGDRVEYSATEMAAGGRGPFVTTRRTGTVLHYEPGSDYAWIARDEARAGASRGIWAFVRTMTRLEDASRFERSEDGVRWEPIGRAEMRDRLEAAYRDIDGVVGAMIEHDQPVRTQAAWYRFVRG